MSHSRILRPLRLVAASLLALVSLTLVASAASAQETCTTPQPYGDTVCGTVTVPDTAPPETTAPTVLGRTQTRFGVTGGDMAGIAAIGGGAVAVGTALVLAARRRRMAELV